MELMLNPAIAWMVAGALLILLEVMLVPGIGFLFAGLAAISVGGLVSVHMIAESSSLVQFLWFFLLTGFWAAVLWLPMKKWRYKTSKGHYKNIVGDKAVVEGTPLTKHAFGTVKWSGTVMKARIAEECPLESIPVGSEVEIVQVDGAVVYVRK